MVLSIWIGIILSIVVYTVDLPVWALTLILIISLVFYGIADIKWGLHINKVSRIKREVEYLKDELREVNRTLTSIRRTDGSSSNENN